MTKNSPPVAYHSLLIKHLKRSIKEFIREAELNKRGYIIRNKALWDDLRVHRYVFVLSTGRAGTKLLTNIFNRSYSAYAMHSPVIDLAHQSYLSYDAGYPTECLKSAILHSRLDLWKQYYSRDLTYIETNNRISMYALALSELLPNSRFIHLIRHPADFVRSGMNRGYYLSADPEQWGHLEPRPSDALHLRWGSLDRVAKIAWQWNTINENIDTFKDSINQNRVITVKSDSLFTNCNCVTQILEHAWISDFSISQIEKMINIRVNKQKKSTFPRYEDWTLEQREMLREYAPLAQRYGFDLL